MIEPLICGNCGRFHHGEGDEEGRCDLLAIVTSPTDESPCACSSQEDDELEALYSRIEAEYLGECER